MINVVLTEKGKLFTYFKLKDTNIEFYREFK